MSASQRVTHQLSPDLGEVTFWCSRCRENTPHDVRVVTRAVPASEPVIGGRTVVDGFGVECVYCEHKAEALPTWATVTP